MKFSDIPGLEDAKERLRRYADDNRIPHAILLEGPEGIGKFALARAFLQYVDCKNRHDGDSCGVCPSCRQHDAMQHIDTIFSFPHIKKDSSKSVISSDYLPQFIEFAKESFFMDKSLWLEKLGNPKSKPMMYVHEATELIRRLSFAPHSSSYKGLIVWQVDKFNEEGSNKLLKLVEEPPGQAIIVMTSDSPMNILPTIYSRTQRIKVLRHPDEVVAQWLVDTGKTNSEIAREVAPLAVGRMNQALKLLANRDDSERFLKYFISLMRLAYLRDIAALKDWAQTVAKESRDTIVNFLEYTARMLRENFIANLHDTSLNLMVPSESEFSKNFARFVNERNIEGLISEVDSAITDIRSNVNSRVVLFDLAITVILLLKN